MRQILWRYFERGAGAGSACDVMFEGGGGGGALFLFFLVDGVQKFSISWSS